MDYLLIALLMFALGYIVGRLDGRKTVVTLFEEMGKNSVPPVLSEVLGPMIIEVDREVDFDQLRRRFAGRWTMARHPRYIVVKDLTRSERDELLENGARVTKETFKPRIEESVAR